MPQVDIEATPAEIELLSPSEHEFGIPCEDLRELNEVTYDFRDPSLVHLVPRIDQAVDEEWVPLQSRSKTRLMEYGGVDSLAQKLGCQLNRGLCPGADHYSLDRRREVFGENKFPVPEMKAFWAMVFENLQDPTLILLMVAALVSNSQSPYEALLNSV